jgi:hypothetical protein
MLRTIAISLILVLSVGIMLPFTNSAHGVRQSVEIGQRRHHRYRSRAWWRRYRARMRQKRLAAELAHRNTMLSVPSGISLGDVNGVAGPALPALPVTSVATTTAAPPVMVSSTSNGAMVSNAANGAVRPRVVNASHSAYREAPATLPGQMNLAVVALARPNPAFLTSREEKKMLGGVAVGDLRRMVIDKMVSSGGWVVNDFMREINGHRVFVVTARTPKDALTPEKAWTFYFTEAGGRIYGLTTDAPVEFADRMTNEAERFIESLRAKTESGNR